MGLRDIVGKLVYAVCYFYKPFFFVKKNQLTRMMQDFAVILWYLHAVGIPHTDFQRKSGKNGNFIVDCLRGSVFF